MTPRRREDTREESHSPDSADPINGRGAVSSAPRFEACHLDVCSLGSGWQLDTRKWTSWWCPRFVDVDLLRLSQICTWAIVIGPYPHGAGLIGGMRGTEDALSRRELDPQTEGGAPRVP